MTSVCTLGFGNRRWHCARQLGLAGLLVAAGCATSRRTIPTQGSVSLAMSFGAIWDDPSRCEEALASGRRLQRPPEVVRIATWNIRWFPDGTMGNAPSKSRTDVDWLACVIAFMDADALALQEIKLTARGREALTRLQARLKELTGSAWHLATDRCAQESMQHVALLTRAERLDVEQVISHGELDPTGTEDGDHGCPGRLRPGLGAYLRSKTGGLDFHLITGHLDSGHEERDFTNRRESWRRLDVLQTRRLADIADPDVVVAGDFNAMGCDTCEDAPDGETERALMRHELAALPHALRVLPPAPPCTHYYEGRGTVLDVFAASATMDEARDAVPRPSGICGAAQCVDLASDHLPAMEHLSDHCPVLLDLPDRDLDP